MDIADQTDTPAALSSVPRQQKPQPPAVVASARIGHMRWLIALLLGVGILINNFDRANISVAIKPLEHDFHLSAGQMGIILSSYL